MASPTDAELKALGAKMAREEMAKGLTPDQKALGQAHMSSPGFLMSTAVAPERSMLQSVGQFAKEGALPFAFGALGGVATGLTPAGPIPGEMAGSALGETVNQHLGIGDQASVMDTQPDLGRVGLAAASPLVGRGIGYGLNAAKSAMQFAGQKGAQALNAMGYEAGLGSINKWAGGSVKALKQKASGLFKLSDDAGAMIPTTKVLDAIDDVMPELRRGSDEAIKANAPVVRRLESLADKIKAGGIVNGKIDVSGKLAPLDLQAELSDLSTRIGSMDKQGLAAFQRVKRALVDSLNEAADAAAGSPNLGPAAQSLVEGRKLWARGSVLERMEELVNGAFKSLRGQGDAMQFNASSVINGLKKDPVYQKAFDAAERAEIEGLFKHLNSIPALRPGAGQQAGSYNRMAQMITGGIGAGLGSMTGNPAVGSTIGFAAGASIPPIVETAKNLTIALTFPEGRAMLREIMAATGGKLGPDSVALLGAFVQGATSEDQQ